MLPEVLLVVLIVLYYLTSKLKSKRLSILAMCGLLVCLLLTVFKVLFLSQDVAVSSCNCKAKVGLGESCLDDAMNCKRGGDGQHSEAGEAITYLASLAIQLIMVGCWEVELRRLYFEISIGRQVIDAITD
jgi:hypothetical protein